MALFPVLGTLLLSTAGAPPLPPSSAPGTARVAADRPGDEGAPLQAEFEDLRAAYRRAAPAPGARGAVRRHLEALRRRAWLPSFEALARRGSSRAAAWCLRHGPPCGLDPSEVALRAASFARLIELAPGSDWLLEEDLDVFAALDRDAAALGAPRVRALLAGLGAETSPPRVRARALRGLARQSEDPLRARRLLERAAAVDGAPEEAARARDELWRLEHLGVGAIAPEFSVRDLSGNALRITDLRRKVVAIELCFGDEPDPEREAARRRLVGAHREDPFVWISVHADGDPAELLRRSQATDEDRVVAWEGGASRPWREAWRLGDEPTLFLIDPAGRIRRRGGDWAGLEADVEGLLQELPPRILAPRAPSGPSAQKGER